MSFIICPSEIFKNCLLYLNPFDIFSFGLVSKILCNIITNSIDDIAIDSIKEIQMILNYFDNSFSIKNIYFTKKFSLTKNYGERTKILKTILKKCKKECIEYIELPKSMMDNSLVPYFSTLINLKKIILTDSQITNIDFLSNLENLEYLSLEDNSYRKYDSIDINIIKNLKKLKYLNCSNNENGYYDHAYTVSVYSLELINNFSDLEHLNLINSCFEEELDLLQLNNLKKLQCIKLSDSVKNFQSIGMLFPNLVEITLINCQGITTFDHLRELPNLKALYLLDVFDSVGMSVIEDSTYDYNSIRYLTQLETIKIYNSLNDIGFMKYLTNLTDIDLEDCSNINDLEPLRKLTKLKHLNLKQCIRITSLEPLKNLLHLQSLNISNYELLYHLIHLQTMEITTLNPSINLISLKKLHIRCENITSLEPLSNLVNIEYLDLQFCQNITSLEPLSNLINITYLNLNLNSCSNINCLVSLSNLVNIEILYLYDCEKITSLEPLRTLIKLTELCVTICSQIDNVDALQNLINLKELYLYRFTKITNYEVLYSLQHIDILHINTYPYNCTDLIELLRQHLPNSYIYS